MSTNKELAREATEFYKTISRFLDACNLANLAGKKIVIVEPEKIGELATHHKEFLEKVIKLTENKVPLEVEGITYKVTAKSDNKDEKGRKEENLHIFAPGALNTIFGVHHVDGVMRALPYVAAYYEVDKDQLRGVWYSEHGMYYLFKEVAEAQKRKMEALRNSVDFSYIFDDILKDSTCPPKK